MSLYELAILGSPTPAEKARLTATITGMVGDLELAIDTDVLLRDGMNVADRDPRAAFAAVYFGGVAVEDGEAARELVEASAPVIPTVEEAGDFQTLIPDFLRSANGLRRRREDAEMTELASALLECVGLLRRQRRVFVSYRRTESRDAALQLHDLLGGRGFEVFLDTHEIRPGDPFQDVLWHRLVDSDVLVMLDTPTYFGSRWTRQEIGRALAKDIQILRVIWPDHTPSKLTNLSETIYLRDEDLCAPSGPVASPVAGTIMLRVERLRSRSIAARYLAITGKLRADVQKIGCCIEAIGAHRAMTVRLLDERIVLAYPVVGVPTAETLHDVVLKATRVDRGRIPILVYDHVGIRDAWAAHLQWLDEQIRTVRAIKVSEAGWRLAALED